jgi:hypothetical protein
MSSSAPPLTRPVLSIELDATLEGSARTGLPAETADETASEERRRRYHFTACVLAVCWCLMGFFYGMSPLVLPVAKAFGEGNSIRGGAFLFGSSIMFLGLDVAGSILLAVMTTRRHLYKELVAASLIAWVLGLLLQALALANRWIVLFLLSFTLLGFSMGTFGIYFLHYELSKWWAHNIPHAHAIAGFIVGFAAISHTLIFGVLTEFTNATTTLLCVAALHALIFTVAWRSGFKNRGFYESTATQGHEVGSRGGGKSEEHTADVSAASKGGPLPAAEVAPRDEVDASASVASVQSTPASASITASAPGSAAAAGAIDELDAGEPTPALTLLCSWRMQLLMAMFVFMMFCGMAMKMLLSTLFEQVCLQGGRGPWFLGRQPTEISSRTGRAWASRPLCLHYV